MRGLRAVGLSIWLRRLIEHLDSGPLETLGEASAVQVRFDERQ